jgi:hypothetical protein
MKANEKVLKVIKHKGLRAFVLIRHDGIDKFRLCVDVKSDLDENYKDSIHVECETDIRIENYNSECRDVIENISFHESLYFEMNHIRTFLSKIGKETDIRFKVIAYNSCDVWKDAGLVSHSMYGILNNKDVYLLSTYVGKDNTASPVKFN